MKLPANNRLHGDLKERCENSSLTKKMETEEKLAQCLGCLAWYPEHKLISWELEDEEVCFCEECYDEME